VGVEPNPGDGDVNGRTIALIAVAVACIAGGAGYVAYAALTADGTTSDAEPAVTVRGDSALPASSKLLVRAVDHSNPRLNGRLFETELAADVQPREVGSLACERVHANASGHGICLAADKRGLGYHAAIFGPGYGPDARFAIPGVPDRARVSADGRYAAFTTFLSGHTYSAAGAIQFSVHTEIVDLRDGERLFKLDELEITRDGSPFDRDDANLWGVTFAGGDRFYATLGAGAQHYLLEGDISSRSARIVREGVECPSLSPDGSRIAYKRRIGDQNRWRLHVLDLDTGRDVALAERRSIDDQPEWLDDRFVVYSDDKSVFATPADGSGRPERIVARASSPVAVR
jgi:hypothetical protein